MSIDPATSDIERPADQPFGLSYIREMNKAEASGETGSTPELEPAVPASVDPKADPAEVKADEPKDDKAAPEGADRDDKGKFKPRNNPVARMQEATAEAARVKAENAELRRQLEARPVPPMPAEPRHVVPAVGEPKLEDFLEAPDPYAALATATARHEVTRILAQERAAAEFQRVAEANHARFEKAFLEDEELPALMQAADDTLLKAGIGQPGATFPAVMLEAIRDSEQGPSIARFLGSHPEELVQYARDVRGLGLSPDAVTVVRRMLEVAVKASSPVPTAAIASGSAAALPRPSAVPIRPLRTSREPAPAADPSELPFGREYLRKMNERERSGA